MYCCLFAEGKLHYFSFEVEIFRNSHKVPFCVMGHICIVVYLQRQNCTIFHSKSKVFVIPIRSLFAWWVTYVLLSICRGKTALFFIRSRWNEPCHLRNNTCFSWWYIYISRQFNSWHMVTPKIQKVIILGFQSREHIKTQLIIFVHVFFFSDI